MLARVDELFKSNENFAFETTLATKYYKQKILNAKGKGYNTTLLFFWLKNPDLAKERVKMRVQEGGHNIPAMLSLKEDITMVLSTFLLFILQL